MAAKSPFGDTMLGLGILLVLVGAGLSLVTRQMLMGDTEGMLESPLALLAMFVATPLASLGILAVGVGLYLRHKAAAPPRPPE